MNVVAEDELLLLVARALQSRGLSSAAAVVQELEQRGTWRQPTWDGERVLSLEQYAAHKQCSATLEELLGSLQTGPDRSLLRKDRSLRLLLPREPVATTAALLQAQLLGQTARRRKLSLRVMEHVQLSPARLQHTFESRGHTHNVYCVAMHPSGECFSSGADDGLVKVWSTATGLLKHTLRGFGGVVVDVAYSQHGKYLVTGAAGIGDGVAVYEHPTYHRIAWLALADEVLVLSLAFFQDEQKRPLLAVALSNSKLRVYRAQGRWDLLAQLDIDEPIVTLSCSREHRLAVGMESSLRVVECAQGQVRLSEPISLLGASVTTIEWSPDGAFMFVAPPLGQPCLYSVVSGEQHALEDVFPNAGGGRPRRRGVYDARFSVNGNLLFVLVGGDDGRNFEMCVMDTLSRALLRRIHAHDAPCFVMANHPVLDHVYMTGGYDGKVRIVNALTGVCIFAYQVSSEVLAGGWSNDGTALVVAGMAGTVSFFSGNAPVSRQLPQQFFASDYDPVTMNATFDLVDAQSGLLLAEHAAMGQVLLNFDGSPVGSVSGLSLEGHISAAQRMAQLLDNAQPGGGGAAAAAALAAGDNLGDMVFGMAPLAAEPENDQDDEGGLSSTSSSFLEEEEEDEEFGEDGVPERSLVRRRSSRHNGGATLLQGIDEEQEAPRRSLRRRLRSANDGNDAELEVGLMEFGDPEDGGQEELVRRSSRQASQKSANRVLVDWNSDEDVEDERDMLATLPPTPPWMRADAQSAEFTWFMPQLGDWVRVFAEGLTAYFEAFCPLAPLPDVAAVEGEWIVTACTYLRHAAQAEAYCEVRLKSADGARELTLPFHTCLGLTDYLVPCALIERSARLAVGDRVQAFFADENQWYPGRVTEMQPTRGWGSVGITWDTGSDGEVTWLHPWELFPLDIEHGLGQVESWFAPSEQEVAEHRRVFGCLVEAMRQMLTFGCFKAAKDCHSSAVRHKVVHSMSFSLLLNRLRRRFYRSVDAVRLDFDLLLQTIEALPKKSRSLAAIECYGKLDACFRDASLQAKDRAEMDALFGSDESPFAVAEQIEEPPAKGKEDGEFEIEAYDEDEELLAVEPEKQLQPAKMVKKIVFPEEKKPRSSKRDRSGKRSRREVEELMAESSKVMRQPARPRRRAKLDDVNYAEEKVAEQEEEEEEENRMAPRPKRAAAKRAVVYRDESGGEESDDEGEDDFAEGDGDEPSEGVTKRRRSSRLQSEPPEEAPPRRSSRGNKAE